MAQKKKANSGSNLKPFYTALGVLAVVGLGVIGWIVLKGKKDVAAIEPVPVEGADNPTALVAKAQGVTVGSEGAPVKMLVFSDYQCPFCAQFASLIEPTLKEEFVKTGKLQYVYYDYPLGGAHKYSFLVARAARCAGDHNKFWEYHNLAFGKQSEWSLDESVPTKKIIDYGADVGIDRKVFQACVESDKYQDVVSANHLLGERLGVNATPTVYLNSRKLSPETDMDLKALRELINKEAGAVAPAPATTSTQ